MKSVFEDYQAGDAQLLELFAASPTSFLTAELPASPIADNVRLAVNAQQRAFGSKTDLPENAAIIVTGQQPALFTGPLYTIYKVITAIKLAAHFRAMGQQSVIPMFWVGSDDHDFEEARTAHVVTQANTLRSFTYAPESYVDGQPLHRVPVDESLLNLIRDVANAVPGSELTSEITEELLASARASKSLADWMARLVARLFQETDLITFVPHDPAIRAEVAWIFRKEIEHPLESTRLLREGAARLAQLGYEPQLVKKENECNFFLEFGDLRRKVVHEAGRYSVPEEKVTFTVDELLAILDQSPERFSPNVVLRCIVQQALFPTAAYVAGPGEVAYWAQFKGVFEFFGLPMPVVYPRAQATLLSTKNRKLLAKLGLSLGDLFAPDAQVLEKALRNAGANPGLDRFESHCRTINGTMGVMRDELAKKVPAVKNTIESVEERVAAELQRIARALLHADEQKVAATQKQVQRLCDTLAPLREPQERVLCIAAFLFEHGWELIPRLLTELDVTSFQLNEVEL